MARSHTRETGKKQDGGNRETAASALPRLPLILTDEAKGREGDTDRQNG